MVSVASKLETDAPEPRQAVSLLDRPVYDIFGWLLVCGCAFLNLANVLVEKEEVGLDFQVLAKLGLIGLA